MMRLKRGVGGKLEERSKDCEDDDEVKLVIESRAPGWRE
jgi:hypothetical protein